MSAQSFPIEVSIKVRKTIEIMSDCIIESTIDGGKVKATLTHIVFYSSMIKGMIKDVNKQDLSTFCVPFSTEIINAFLACVYGVPCLKVFREKRDSLESISSAFRGVYPIEIESMKRIADFLAIHRYFDTEISQIQIEPQWLGIQIKYSITFLKMLIERGFRSTDSIISMIIYQISKVPSKNHYNAFKTGVPLFKINVKELHNLPQPVIDLLTDISFNGIVNEEDHSDFKTYFDYGREKTRYNNSKTESSLPRSTTFSAPTSSPPPWVSRGGN